MQKTKVLRISEETKKKRNSKNYLQKYKVLSMADKIYLICKQKHQDLIIKHLDLIVL